MRARGGGGVIPPQQSLKMFYLFLETSSHSSVHINLSPVKSFAANHTKQLLLGDSQIISGVVVLSFACLVSLYLLSLGKYEGLQKFLWVGNTGINCKWALKSFGDNENALNLDCADGLHNSKFTKNHSIIDLKWVNFMNINYTSKKLKMPME